MEKLIITAAMIGGITTREKNPHPPMTPKEIAESAIECHKAGAAVCHVHVRDPQTHASSMKFELYKEVYERIREKCDLIINLTTGAGGRLLYDSAGNTWNTSELKSPEERVEHVVRLKPELCSLDVGTLNFGPRAFINLVSIVEKMAKMIKEAGVKPELEVFDLGHIRIAKHLIQQGIVEKPALFQLCLGIPWGIEATTENMVYMRNNLPEGCLLVRLRHRLHAIFPWPPPPSSTAVMRGSASKTIFLFGKMFRPPATRKWCERSSKLRPFWTGRWLPARKRAKF